MRDINKIRVEMPAMIDVDDVIYSLQNTLSTGSLIEFAIKLGVGNGVDLGIQNENYYNGLKKELEKRKI